VDPLDGFKVARMKPSNPWGMADEHERVDTAEVRIPVSRTAAHRRSTCAVAGRNSVLKALNWPVQ
jgi:hypothetical protein